MADYDLIGDIAIIKSESQGKIKTEEEKLKQANELLKKTNIKSVLERIGNVHGRLRTIKTKYIAGRKNLIAYHRENGCSFKLNIETCYFSPRLSEERKLISEKIKREDKVLVMFAGVGVYPIVIYHYKKPKKIIGIELGRDCCRYFEENLKLNKISENRIRIIQGDVKKKINKDFMKENGKFDVVIMARPNLEESFLKYGLIASKKGTRLFYYGFCNVDEIDDLIKDLISESKKFGRKIKFIKRVRAGDIAPYKFRYRLEFKILN